MIEQRINYNHNNPVEASFVRERESWTSSILVKVEKLKFRILNSDELMLL